MEYTDLLTFINTCGFPIACVLLLAYYVRELTNSHKEEIQQLSEKLDIMSEAISKLSVNLAKVFLLEEKDDENE